MNSKKYLRTWGRISLTVIFITASVFNFIRIDSVSHSASDTLRPFIIQTAILILLLLPVYYLLKRNKNPAAKK